MQLQHCHCMHKDIFIAPPVACILQAGHSHRLLPALGSMQCCHVDQVGQVGTAEAGRAPRNRWELHIWREWDVLQHTKVTAAAAAEAAARASAGASSSDGGQLHIWSKGDVVAGHRDGA